MQICLLRPSIGLARQPAGIIESESVVPISNTHQSPLKKAPITCVQIVHFQAYNMQKVAIQVSYGQKEIYW